MTSSEESFEISSSGSSADDENDILSSIPQLSDELEYFGLRPLPHLRNEENHLMLQTPISALISALIDAVWNVLQLHRTSRKQHDEAEDRRHRLADDNKNLRAQVDRMKAELMNKDKLLFTASEKEQKLTSECDKLHNDLKKKKDEVRRLSTQVSQRDTHYAHELRRKEHEVLHVQEQLRHNLCMSHSVMRKESSQKQENYKKFPQEINSNTVFNIASKSQGEYEKSTEQEELYKQAICKFENNNRSLLEENISLRDVYCKLHTNLGLVTQQFALIAEKFLKYDAGYDLCEDKEKSLMLPSSDDQISYDDIKKYHKELHSISDRYLSTLQMILEKLTSYMESHSS